MDATMMAMIFDEECHAADDEELRAAPGVFGNRHHGHAAPLGRRLWLNVESTVLSMIDSTCAIPVDAPRSPAESGFTPKDPIQ